MKSMMKKSCVLLIGGIILFGLSLVAHSENWDGVLAQMKAKLAQRTQEVKDMTLESEHRMIAQGKEMVSNMKMVTKGDKFKMETVMQMPDAPAGMGEMKTVVINDGKDMWMIAPMIGKKKLPDAEKKAMPSKTYSPQDFLDDYQVIGIENIGGRECYVLQHIKETAMKAWFDKKNMVLVRNEIVVSPRETMVNEYSDFRKVYGNWQMPYLTKTYANGKQVGTSTVKLVKINQGISDDVFNPDAVGSATPALPNMMDMMKGFIK